LINAVLVNGFIGLNRIGSGMHWAPAADGLCGVLVNSFFEVRDGQGVREGNPKASLDKPLKTAGFEVNIPENKLLDDARQDLVGLGSVGLGVAVQDLVDLLQCGAVGLLDFKSSGVGFGKPKDDLVQDVFCRLAVQLCIVRHQQPTDGGLIF